MSERFASPDAHPVDRAIASRRSVRAFTDQPVSREAIEHVLQIASRAPSGTNTQPWKVYVLTGAAREALSRDILDAFDQPDWAQSHLHVYDFYATEW